MIIDDVLAYGAAAGDPSGLTGLSGWVAGVIDALGPTGVGLLVALENLFPPIPSEVILPLAGFLSGQGRMSLPLAIMAATVGSVVGALVLYEAGRLLGPQRLRAVVRWLPLVEVGDVDRSEAWFARYGTKAVLLGRLVPVVRSLVSIPAGIDGMPRVPFLIYTGVGSAVWNAALIGAGYGLGSAWQNVGDYSGILNTVVVVAIVLAVLWFVVNRLRKRRGRQA